MGADAVWEQDQRLTKKWSGQGQTSQSGDAASVPGLVWTPDTSGPARRIWGPDYPRSLSPSSFWSLTVNCVQKQKEKEILLHVQQETMPNKESQSPFYLKTLSFEGSVNTTCSVDLRLIDARFVNYNSQALPPSVYSLCT